MSNIILAIDTSMNYCSVAIYNKKKIYTLSDHCNKEHAKKLLPMINQLLLNIKIKLEEINYIACSKGPGNFTGIRIAMVVAQSLSLSLGIPILDVSTLAILAEKNWRKYQEKKVLISIYAKTNQVYWAAYVKDDQLLWVGEETESLLNFYEIKEKIKHLKNDWSLIGDGWGKINYKNNFYFKKIKIIFPNAQDIIPFSLFKIKNKNFLHATEIKPNYLNNTF